MYQFFHYFFPYFLPNRNLSLQIIQLSLVRKVPLSIIIPAETNKMDKTVNTIFECKSPPLGVRNAMKTPIPNMMNDNKNP